MSCLASNHSYMSLCQIPAKSTRDGYAGPNAHLYLPFYGHWFANGGTYAFANTVAAQDRSRFMGGRDVPTCFKKEGCNCC